MKLKELLEQQTKISPMKSFSLLEKMIQLEAIENWLNAMYGIELDIEVKPVEKRQGRYYGENILEKLI